MSMYDQTLGRAYNYGQSFIPGKAGLGEGSPMQQSFLDRQYNMYGRPRPKQPQQPQQPQPATQVPVMPNGVPLPQQQPQGKRGSVDVNTGVYTAGEAPQLNFAPQYVERFNDPTNRNVHNRQQSLVEQLLANPSSMNDDVVNQMKGRQRDTAALLEQQSMGQLQNQLASRGVAVNQGQGLGQQRALMESTNRSILGGQRDIDIQKAAQDRNDLLTALGAADTFQNSTLQRALAGHSANLQGISSNTAQQQAMLQAALQQHGMNEDMLGRQSQSIFNMFGNQNQQRGLDLQQQQIRNQQSQFDTDFGFRERQYGDQLRMNEQSRQDAAANAAAANQRWLDQEAYDAMMAQQQEQDQLLQWLLGLGQ